MSSLLEGYEVGERFRDRLKQKKSRATLERELQERRLAADIEEGRLNRGERVADREQRGTEAVNRAMLERDLAKMTHSRWEMDRGDARGRDAYRAERDRTEDTYRSGRDKMTDTNAAAERALREREIAARIDALNNPRTPPDYEEDVELDDMGQVVGRARRYTPRVTGSTPTGTPQNPARPRVAPSGAAGMSPQDEAAAAWAKQNPNDPRAREILKRLQR